MELFLESIFCVDCLLEASNFSFRDSLMEFREFKRDVLGGELLITKNAVGVHIFF